MADVDRVVLDATPAIFLAKVGLLGRIAELPFDVLMPPLVKQEVVDDGLKIGAPEASEVKRLIEEGKVSVHLVGSRDRLRQISTNPKLSAADSEALALAYELNVRLIADEDALRFAASSIGVKLGGSVYLLRQLVDAGKISREEALAAVDDMIDGGWYCSPRLYRSIWSLFSGRSKE
jgi:predicted nucleic acid-binding protein